jgi:hypothetical protein
LIALCKRGMIEKIHVLNVGVQRKQIGAGRVCIWGLFRLM